MDGRLMRERSIEVMGLRGRWGEEEGDMARGE